MDLKPGMLARSKAGHDKGCIYVIILVENEYVYLADGGLRPLRRMKKKKRKHIQPVLTVQTENVSDDAALRKVIRDYIRKGAAAEDEAAGIESL